MNQILQVADPRVRVVVRNMPSTSQNSGRRRRQWRPAVPAQSPGYAAAAVNDHLELALDLDVAAMRWINRRAGRACSTDPGSRPPAAGGFPRSAVQVMDCVDGQGFAIDDDLESV